MLESNVFDHKITCTITYWHWLTITDTLWPLTDMNYHQLTLTNTYWHWLTLTDTLWLFLTLSTSFWVLILWTWAKWPHFLLTYWKKPNLQALEYFERLIMQEIPSLKTLQPDPIHLSSISKCLIKLIFINIKFLRVSKCQVQICIECKNLLFWLYTWISIEYSDFWFAYDKYRFF